MPSNQMELKQKLTIEGAEFEVSTEHVKMDIYHVVLSIGEGDKIDMTTTEARYLAHALLRAAEAADEGT